MEYRVSKYDPANRDKNGIYKKNEWTSFSDIGETFDNGVLEKEEYIRVESNYINFIIDLLQNLNISTVRLEKQEPKNKYALSNINIYDELFNQIFQENLRENFWCEFHCKDLYFWVGYDFYLHINSKKNICDILKKIAKTHELFIEEIK